MIHESPERFVYFLWVYLVVDPSIIIQIMIRIIEYSELVYLFIYFINFIYLLY